MKERLSGRKFGKLTVLEEREKRANYQTYWKCACECGNVKYVREAHLIGGKIQSCGCGRGDGARKHGGSSKNLYHVWRNMKSRCGAKTAKQYKDYGGRGIKVCDEWRNNFKAFYDWAMTHGYADGLTLDRIDNNGNYEPSNCRWATRGQQVNNRRNNIYITVGGETKTLKEWCDILNKDYVTVYRRYKRLHWTFERAVQ